MSYPLLESGETGPMSDLGQKPEGRALYRYPYPSPELAARYPFVAHEHQRVDDRTMRDRVESFRASADRRRNRDAIAFADCSADDRVALVLPTSAGAVRRRSRPRGTH